MQYPIVNLIIACLLAVLVTACGGGGGGGGGGQIINPITPPGPPRPGDTFEIDAAGSVSFTSPTYNNEATQERTDDNQPFIGRWGITAVAANWAHWAKNRTCTTTTSPPANCPYAARGKGATVALIDEGVPTMHPEFMGAIVSSTMGAAVRQGTVVLATISDDGTQTMHVATISFRKVYGAATYNVTLLGDNNTKVTLSVNYKNPVKTTVTSRIHDIGTGTFSTSINMDGMTETVTMTITTLLGSPLILTAGNNVITNSYDYFQPRAIPRSLGDFDVILNQGRGQEFEPVPPIYPFTPEAFSFLLDGEERVDTHGGHVGGIIAGRYNMDSNGIVGVAPEASLLPIKYLGGGGGNHDPSYFLNQIDEAFNYAVANNAFVANNSWGSDVNLVKVKLTSSLVVRVGRKATVYGVEVDPATISPGTGSNSVPITIDYKNIPENEKFIWIEVPQIYRAVTNSMGSLTAIVPREADRFLTQILSSATRDANSGTGMLFVFALGNAGWNSETGRIRTCVNDLNTPFNCIGSGQITMSLADLNMPYVYGHNGASDTANTLSNGGSVRLDFVQENQMDALLYWPSTISANPSAIRDNWLNVIAVDSSTAITDFSSGCGATRDFCLAAPGEHINSAIPVRLDRTFPNPGSGAQPTTMTVRNTYGIASGTSQAAPFVSGAAAVVKGAFPDLTPATVAAILKDSATGLGECASMTGNKRGDPYAPSCTSTVYGHGMLNISAALNPAGNMQMSDTSTSHALSDMRFNLSPVFGQAAWQYENFRIGALDRYGRSYPAYVNLNSGIVVSKPIAGNNGIAGAGVHAVYGAPLLQNRPPKLATAADALSAFQYQYHMPVSSHIRNVPINNIEFSATQQGSYAHRQARMHFANAQMAWRYMQGAQTFNTHHDSEASDFWAMPLNKNRHRLSYTHNLNDEHHKIGIAYDKGNNFWQTGMRLSYHANSWQLFGESGIVSESQQMLGATFGGGMNINQSSTHYRRIGAVWHPLSALSKKGENNFAIYANYTNTDTQTKTSDLLENLSAKGDALSAGMRFGNWRVGYWHPLVITQGNMQFSLVDGYKDNELALRDYTFDLSAKNNRPQIIELMYRNKISDNVNFATGINHIRNAPNKNYSGDTANFSAALQWSF